MAPRARTKEKRERETGFEPATPTLARSCSTTELFPQTSGRIVPRPLGPRRRRSARRLAHRGGRGLRRDGVDEEAAAPLVAGHLGQLRNDLQVPVEMLERPLAQRRG